MVHANEPHRADAIYRMGIETLIEQCDAIVVGKVSKYSREIVSKSKGSEEPLKWIVHGVQTDTVVLKGDGLFELATISRAEQSLAAPLDPLTQYWEPDLGYLEQNEKCLFFFDGNKPHKILPIGKAKPDLLALTESILAIQSVGDQSVRATRWLSLISDSKTDEIRKVALRSFIADKGRWELLGPVLGELLSDSTVSIDLRAFCFGLVAHNFTKERWGVFQEAVADFLCRSFATQNEPRLAIQNLYSMGTIFAYCDVEEQKTARQGIRRRFESVLEKRPSISLSGLGAEAYLEKQFLDFRSSYLTK